MINIIQINNEQRKIYDKVKEKGYSNFVATYIAKQNITDIEKYLNPKYEDLETPLLMKDAVKAMKYFEKNYKDFLLVGDYDTDGVTASAAVYLFVKEKFNYEIPVYIPERKEGYGLQKANIDYALKIGKKAIITVDNGIAAHEAVAYAKEKGLFVILTDHHEVKENKGIPIADFVINPKQKNCMYSDKNISGAVVAWNCLKLIDENLAKKYLPLVLLGTIADVVPLTNQNRIITKLGTNIHVDDIEVPSIKLLLKYLKKEYLERELIEFKISPMINSSGRMENALQAFDFFISTEENDILKKIEKLEQTNDDRKDKQAEIEPYVMKQIDNNKQYQLIFPIENVEFPNAIVGIMAGKVLEETNKPTIVFYEKTVNDKECFSGSGRSPEWFNFQDLIKRLENNNILVNGGGHKLAVGLTFFKDKLEEFKKIFDETIKNYKYVKKEIEVYQIFELKENKLENEKMLQNILDDLNLLEPFGNMNPQPDIAFKYQNPSYFKKIADKHLRFTVYGINVISFFNKFSIYEKGIIVGLPQKNIWYNRNNEKIVNYQILLKNIVKD